MWNPQTWSQLKRKLAHAAVSIHTTRSTILQLEVTINAFYDINKQQLCLLHHFISKFLLHVGKIIIIFQATQLQTGHLASHFSD